MTKEEREAEYLREYRKAYNSSERAKAARRRYYMKNRERLVREQNARNLAKGARLRKFKWRTDLHPMNGEVVLLMMGGVPVVGKYDTKREAWCRPTDIGFEVVMYQGQVAVWSYIPDIDGGIGNG